jgi:hypothetical protein
MGGSGLLPRCFFFAAPDPAYWDHAIAARGCTQAPEGGMVVEAPDFPDRPPDRPRNASLCTSHLPPTVPRGTVHRPLHFHSICISIGKLALGAVLVSLALSRTYLGTYIEVRGTHARRQDCLSSRLPCAAARCCCLAFEEARQLPQGTTQYRTAQLLGPAPRIRCRLDQRISTLLA